MALEDGNENVQVVAGQGDTPSEPPAPAPQGDMDQPAPGTQEEPTSEPEKGPVPYDRFEEVNQRAKTAEAEALQMRQFIMQAQQQQGQPAADPFQQFIQSNGIGADGFVTTEDLGKVAQFFQQQSQQTVQLQQQEQWFAAHPDYVGTVTTPTGQMSENLQKAIQSDPALGVSLRRHWDPVLAYHAARGAMNRPQQTTNQAVNQVDQIRSGQVAPQGISAATGGGGQVDQRSAIGQMSDTEFQQWWHNKRSGS